MNTQAILSHADALFAQGEYERAGLFLEESAKDALAQRQYETALSVLNELTGYYRNTGNIDSAWACADKILWLLDALQLKDSLAGATSLLNIATVHKAAGLFGRALELYREVEAVYLSAGVSDIRMAGLYNNMCATCIDLKSFHDAVNYGNKALALAARNNIPEEKMSVVRDNLNVARENLKNDV